MLLLLLLVSSQFSTSYQEDLTWQHEVKDGNCQNCWSDNRPSCSIDAGCETLGDNLVDVVSPVNSEEECQHTAAGTPPQC